MIMTMIKKKKNRDDSKLDCSFVGLLVVVSFLDGGSIAREQVSDDHDVDNEGGKELQEKR